MKPPEEKPLRLVTRDAARVLHIPSIFPGTNGELCVIPPARATPDVFTFSARSPNGGRPRAVHVHRDVLQDAIHELQSMVENQ